jgi:hypothetical protein
VKTNFYAIGIFVISLLVSDNKRKIKKAPVFRKNLLGESLYLGVEYYNSTIRVGCDQKFQLAMAIR